MNLGELVRDLAYFNPGWSPSDINQRCRLLREARLLPHAGRGRTAPRISPADAAVLVIGMAAAERTIGIVDTTRRYLGLVCVGSPAGPVSGSLAEAMAAFIADPALLEPVRRIVINRAWPAAEIVYRKGKKGKKVATDRFETADTTPGPSRHNLLRIECAIDPRLLAEIGGHMGGLVDVRWVGDPA